MTNSIILLNADYTFLNFVDFKKALALMTKEKIEVIKFSDKEIKTFSGSVKIPSIIKLVYLIKSIYKRKILYSKNNIYLRDGYTCVYCGNKFEKNQLTIDHIIPKSRGGKDSYLNCVTSCKSCNSKKSNKLIDELGLILKFKPYEPSLYDIIILRLKNLGQYEIISNLLK